MDIAYKDRKPPSFLFFELEISIRPWSPVSLSEINNRSLLYAAFSGLSWPAFCLRRPGFSPALPSAHHTALRCPLPWLRRPVISLGVRGPLFALARFGSPICWVEPDVVIGGSRFEMRHDKDSDEWWIKRKIKTGNEKDIHNSICLKTIWSTHPSRNVLIVISISPCWASGLGSPWSPKSLGSPHRWTASACSHSSPEARMCRAPDHCLARRKHRSGTWSREREKEREGGCQKKRQWKKNRKQTRKR